MSILNPFRNYILPLWEYYSGTPHHMPTVYLRLTPLCNSRCIMCDEWHAEEHTERREKENQMSTEEYKKLIKDLADSKIERLQFGGGEPLMHPNGTELIEYAKGLGLSTRILTNGTMLADKTMAEKLARGIDEVWFSIDGVTPEQHDHIRGIPGAFQKVVQGIKNMDELRKNGPRYFRIAVATHISPNNMYDPEKMIELVKGLNVDFMLFTPIYTGNYGETHFNSHIENNDDLAKTEEFLKKVKQAIYKSDFPVQTNPISLDIAAEYYKNPNCVKSIKCMIGAYGLAFVETNGNIYPCTAYIRSLGNVRKQSFKEIWFGEEARKVRADIRSLKCGGCFHLQTQKNHLYNFKILFNHFFELPKAFRQLVRSNKLSDPGEYK